MDGRQKIAVLTGAGVSAESGLSTFRDNNGLWDKYDPMEVASIEGWYRNRAKVLEFYNTRRLQLKDVSPNDAHKALVQLEKDYDVTVITQNVDNLHERAGSSDIIHLHGELTKVRPESGVYDCDGSEREVVDVGYTTVSLGDKAANGSQLRPHIVFFGEAVPRLTDAAKAVAAADIVLIVGTSLQVYPAAGLYRYAKPDASIYVIDPADVPISGSNITHIKETATAGMKYFMSALSSLAK